MCGICGFFNVEAPRHVRLETLEEMSSLISHRGPDDEGYYIDDRIAFGHRRLSILDLAGGHQPMTTTDGRFTIIYNGEIYNYVELRRELLRRGYTFQTNSDTEVIVAGFMLDGLKIFLKLNGMFALAIWDKKDKKLTLARDRLGIKPLYCSVQESKVYFASEIKSIQAATNQRSLDEEAFKGYMSYGYVPSDKTLIQGITCVSPGTVVTIDADNITKQVYWQHEYHQQNQVSEAEYIEQLDWRINLAVKRRMISDVEIGAFLSGGVDSSLIVAIMAKYSPRPIKTFSIGFADRGSNEFEYSRAIAKQFKTDHLEILYNQEDFLNLLDEAIWYQEEPLRHVNCVPLLHLARAAKRKATVILTGEGSDELFLGYYKYARANSVNSLVGKVPFLPKDLFMRRYLNRMPKYLLKRALKPQYQNNENDPMVEDFMNSDAPTWVERLADVECRHWLITLLMKQDRMTMASAVESRVPFLDHELVEWAHNLPINFKLRNGVGKYLVKKLAERFFTPEFLQREKMGFPVPIGQWMREGHFRERMHEIFYQKAFAERELFETRGIQVMLKGFSSLKDRKLRNFHQIILWRVFTFELWAQMYLDRRISVPLTRSTDIVV